MEGTDSRLGPGLTELGSAASKTDHHWLKSRICSVWSSDRGGSC